ncbi:MAG: DNA gyrase inhibitor YacG [Planctomycetaceae bacterium]|nr:DNA gyrase inhibitor YacG [Planctomycetaceae bacterium]
MSLPTVKCAYCKQVEVARADEFYPFCSKRCKMLDLGGWVNESYRIPGPPGMSSETEVEELAAELDDNSETN